MAGYGVSFVPGSKEDNGNGKPGEKRSPIQQAIEILSLRLPKFYGSGSIAPAPLLNSPGGLGQAPRSGISLPLPGPAPGMHGPGLGAPMPVGNDQRMSLAPMIPSPAPGVSRPMPSPTGFRPIATDAQRPQTPVAAPPYMAPPQMLPPPRITPGEGPPIQSPPVQSPANLEQILRDMMADRPPSGLSPRLRGDYY